MRSRYLFRCGYCGVSETEVGSQLTIDHFQPLSHGGTDDAENLVYACYACNGFKGAVWDAQNSPILHPLRDDLSRHISENADGTLSAITEAGQRHIDALHLNREQLIDRRRRIAALRETERQLDEKDNRIVELERRIRAKERSRPRRRKPRPQ